MAITRAVYKCYIYRITSKYYNNSSLGKFLTAIGRQDESLIAYKPAPAADKTYRYRETEQELLATPKLPVTFLLQHSNWTKMSYTMLAQKHEGTSLPRSRNKLGSYDQFIFSQLARGNKTGNLLHYIFENVHFTDDRNWKHVIDEALKSHLPQHSEQYAPMLLEMLQQVLNAPIEVNGNSFKLSEVSLENRIHEFEFDFPVPEYNPSDLNSLTNENIEVRVSWDKPLEGIINGKIDLFFECRGKYYILDWKSNYLGDSLDAYSAEALAFAMNESNYHLQYLLYTLAAKKYLQSRVKNFDYNEHFGGVIYLFVRGIRSNSDSRHLC